MNKFNQMSVPYADIQDAYLRGEAPANELFDAETPDDAYLSDEERARNMLVMSPADRILMAEIDKIQPPGKRLSLEEETLHLKKSDRANELLERYGHNIPEKFRGEFEEGRESRQELLHNNLRYIAYFVRSTMSFHTPTENHPERQDTAMQGRIVSHLSTMAGHLGFSDRFSIAAEAFLETIDKHYKKQGNIRTYATWKMVNKLMREQTEQFSALSIPWHQRQTISQERKRRSTSKVGGMIIEASDLITELDARTQYVPLSAVESLFEQEHIDETDDPVSLAEILPEDAETESLYNLVAAQLIGEHIDSMLATLTEREQRILELRFGLGPFATPLTLEEVGHEFNLTRERIRQIEGQALAQLRWQAQTSVDDTLDIYESEDSNYGIRPVVPLSLDDDDRLGIYRPTPTRSDQHHRKNELGNRYPYSLTELERMKQSGEATS